MKKELTPTTTKGELLQDELIELREENSMLKQENVTLKNKLLFTTKLYELSEWASKETDIVSRVVIKYYYVEHMRLSGAAFLKDAARYIDARNEALNENKTWFSLIGDYAKKVDTDKTTRF